MRFLLSAVVLLSIVNSVFAQRTITGRVVDVETQNPVANANVITPNPDLAVDAKANFMHFIGNTIRYPAAARRAGIEGIVDIEFRVDEKGKLDKTKILNNPGAMCGDEVKNALRKVPEEILAALVKETSGNTFLFSVLFGLEEPMKRRGNKPQSTAYQLEELVVIAHQLR